MIPASFISDSSLSSVLRLEAIHKHKPDGSVIEFQADLSGLEEITRWVLSWGSKAKVLGPPELKQRVQDELKKLVVMNE